jgi:hypothetical protein
MQWLVSDPNDAGSVSLERPLYVDPNAYVTGGVLVAELDSFVLGALQRLRRVVVTARIVPSELGSGWALTEGIFAGRFELSDILATLEVLRDPETGKPLCSDSPTYPTFKQSICSTADINVAGLDDGTAPCDAASWSWQFIAEPAYLTEIDFTPAEHDCDESVRPGNERCDR